MMYTAAKLRGSLVEFSLGNVGRTLTVQDISYSSSNFWAKSIGFRKRRNNRQDLVSFLGEHKKSEIIDLICDLVENTKGR